MAHTKSAWAVYDHKNHNRRELWLNGMMVAHKPSWQSKDAIFPWTDEQVVYPPFEVNSTFKPGKIWGDENAIPLTHRPRRDILGIDAGSDEETQSGAA